MDMERLRQAIRTVAREESWIRRSAPGAFAPFRDRAARRPYGNAPSRELKHGELLDG